jgi:hypothetical protein
LTTVTAAGASESVALVRATITQLHRTIVFRCVRRISQAAKAAQRRQYSSLVQPGFRTCLLIRQSKIKKGGSPRPSDTHFHDFPISAIPAKPPGWHNREFTKVS